MTVRSAEIRKQISTSLMLKLPQYVGLFLTTNGIDVTRLGYWFIDPRDHPGPYPNVPTACLFLFGVPFLLVPYWVIFGRPNINIKDSMSTDLPIVAKIIIEVFITIIIVTLIILLNIESLKLFLIK